MTRLSPPTAHAGRSQIYTQRQKTGASANDSKVEKTRWLRKETNRKSVWDGEKLLGFKKGLEEVGGRPDSHTELAANRNRLVYLVSRCLSICHKLYNMLWKSHNYITCVIKSKKTESMWSYLLLAMPLIFLPPPHLEERAHLREWRDV